jgi:hypothetical protein
VIQENGVEAAITKEGESTGLCLPKCILPVVGTVLAGFVFARSTLKCPEFAPDNPVPQLAKRTREHFHELRQ